jgi:hypothetical protein
MSFLLIITNVEICFIKRNCMYLHDFVLCPLPDILQGTGHIELFPYLVMEYHCSYTNLSFARLCGCLLRLHLLCVVCSHSGTFSSIKHHAFN